MPHVVPTYACDICGATYRDQESALRCEKAGTPVLPAWVSAVIEAKERIPVFAWHEGGWVEDLRPVLRNGGPEYPWPGDHQWNVICTIHRGSQGYGEIEVEYLDPRHMHWCYVTPDKSDRHEFQQVWLAKYGLELPKITMSEKEFCQDAGAAMDRIEREGAIMLLDENGKYHSIHWPLKRLVYLPT